MPKLVINNGTANAVEFDLKTGVNTFGRGFTSDFRIEDPSVSGQHAEIIVEEGSVTVRDLRSTNGTFINRSQIREGFLQPGQILSLGAVEMLFLAEAPASGNGSNDIARTVALPLVGGIKITRPSNPAQAGGMRTPANYPVPTGPTPNLTTQPTTLTPPKGQPRQAPPPAAVTAQVASPISELRGGRNQGFQPPGNGALRSLGFGLGAAVLCGGIWTLAAVLAGQDVALEALPLTGLACGFAVRLASRNQGGAAFGLLSAGCALLGMFLGELGQALSIRQISFATPGIAALAGGVLMAGLVCGVRVNRKLARARA